MNVFLDSSVLLAACGRATGASRAGIDAAAGQGWSLLVSDYVSAEVEANLAVLPVGASDSWAQIRTKLPTVPDVLPFEWPAVFAPARDRPILFTASAWAEVLLTLDRRDFAELLGTSFNGLAILKARRLPAKGARCWETGRSDLSRLRLTPPRLPWCARAAVPIQSLREVERALRGRRREAARCWRSVPTARAYICACAASPRP